MSTNLEISREGRVLSLKLNRPEKRNALSLALCTELLEAFREAQNDGSVRAILLSANGPVFCAGMDLDEALAPDAEEHTALHQELFTMGLRSVKPIVAGVAGPALGGGLGLVVNAHVVIAAQGSSFGLTEIRLGMWPFVIYRPMVLAVGERRTLELTLTGRIFGTQEALAWGLVHQVTPPFELEDRAEEVARQVAGFSPAVVRRGLEYVNRAREMNLVEASELALRSRAAVFAGEDFHEGVAAFREKRPPRW